MKGTTMTVKLIPALALAATLGLGGPVALAQSKGETLTKQECSACHMAYPGFLLPKRSWSAIATHLSDHFGEDASLPEADRAEIEAYLVATAADRPGKNPRWLKAIPATEVPLRISQLPWFTNEHGSWAESRAKSDPAIGSVSNCAACHKGAESGHF